MSFSVNPFKCGEKIRFKGQSQKEQDHFKIYCNEISNFTLKMATNVYHLQDAQINISSVIASYMIPSDEPTRLHIIISNKLISEFCYWNNKQSVRHSGLSITPKNYFHCVFGNKPMSEIIFTPLDIEFEVLFLEIFGK